MRDILRIGIPAAVSTTINYVGIMVLTGVVARLWHAGSRGLRAGHAVDFLLLSFAFSASAPPC